MFRIGSIAENEVLILNRKNTAPVLDALIRGLKADRLVQKNLIDIEELDLPNTTFAFKITYPHTKDRAAVIQLTECGRVIKIHIESDHPNGFSGAGYEFQFYPTVLLRTAPHDEIEEFARTHLFMLAYILLKLSSGYDFVITRDKKKLDTDNPAVAIYEACIDADMRSTVLTYNEPELFESNRRVIYISKNSGVAQVSGAGVSPMSITLTEMFVKMMTPQLTVEYIEA